MRAKKIPPRTRPASAPAATAAASAQLKRAEAANEAIDAYAQQHVSILDSYRRLVERAREEGNEALAEGLEERMYSELMSAQEELEMRLTDYYHSDGNSDVDASRMARDMAARVRADIRLRTHWTGAQLPQRHSKEGGATSGPAESLVDMSAIRAGYDAYGADAVYLVHNHPSGTMRPSPEDMRLLEKIAGMFGKRVVKDGIIIDVTSGKYCTFDTGGLTGTGVSTRPEVEVGHTASRFDGRNAALQAEFEKAEPVRITGSGEVARFVAEKRLGTEGKISMLLISRNGQVTGNFITDYESYADMAFLIADDMVRLATRYGASSVIPYGNVPLKGSDIRELRDEVARLSGGKVKMLDALEITNGLRRDYRSANDEGILEPEAAYGGMSSLRSDHNEGGGLRYRPVEDPALEAELDMQPSVRAYRAMQVIDGKLYSPMASGNKKSLSASYGLNQWDVATELAFNFTDEMMAEVERLNNSRETGSVDVIPGKLKFEKKAPGGKCSLLYHLKTDETDVWSYNHNSDSMLNDQFKAAYRRGNLVVVEAQVPIPDLESGYRAPYSKDPVGRAEWKSGDVASQLPKEMKRTVYLSRYCKPLRVLSNKEVAEWIGERLTKAEKLTGKKITLYEACFHPEVKSLLETQGFSFVPVKPTKGKVGRILSGHRDYMSDAKIAELNKSLGAADEWLGRYEDGEQTGDWLSFNNDPWSKASGERLRSERQQKQNAGRGSKEEKMDMLGRVEELSQKLNTPVRIIEDVESPGAAALTSRQKNAKGWYDPATGEVVVVLPNHAGEADVAATVLHEVVAHKGLRELFGERFDAFLDAVFAQADERVRERIVRLAMLNGWGFREATEEYLAGLAENTDFEKMDRRWWGKVKELFHRMLGLLGIETRLGDNELRYVLWASWRNLREGARLPSLHGKEVAVDGGFMAEAEKIAKEYELKVGDYGVSEKKAQLSRERRIEEAINERFNEELEQQIEGRLPDGHIYELGLPGEILRSTGVPALPIQLSAKRLREKATEYGHDFDLGEIKDLVKELQTPMAVFSYGNKGKMQNIIIGIESNGKQFMVGLFLNPTVNGKALEINSVRNVFPKNNAEWLNWISQGKLLYADKQKIQALIDKQRTILADVDYLDLEDVAKVIKEFENPKTDEGFRFRAGNGNQTARDEYDERVRTKRKAKPGDKAATKTTNRAGQLAEAYLDSMRALRILQEAVSHETGRPVEDHENAYISENAMSSRNKTQEEAYKRDFFNPLSMPWLSCSKGKRSGTRGLLTISSPSMGLNATPV